jgi:hypothetical protein
VRDGVPHHRDPDRQWFVAATLAILLGSLLGFLCWNFPPRGSSWATAGRCDRFLLGVLTVRTTFCSKAGLRRRLVRGLRAGDRAGAAAV